MQDIIRYIKELKIQSANTIARESLKHLKKMAGKNGFDKRFFYYCKKLDKARPTAAVLHNCIELIKKEPSMKTLDTLLDRLNSAHIIAKNSMRIMPRKKRIVILTHCHSTNVVAAIIEAKKHFNIDAFVTETRPKDQGLLTSRDLIKKKIKVDYIIDSAIGEYINKVDVVLVGADAMRKEGLVNKVGTYPLAVMAKEHKKPFYVLTTTLTIDKRKHLVIEERPKTEITHKHLTGAKIHNPAFDITPWKYVSGIVTEKGIYSPKKIMKTLR